MIKQNRSRNRLLIISIAALVGVLYFVTREKININSGVARSQKNAIGQLSDASERKPAPSCKKLLGDLFNEMSRVAPKDDSDTVATKRFTSHLSSLQSLGVKREDKIGLGKVDWAQQHEMMEHGADIVFFFPDKTIIRADAMSCQVNGVFFSQDGEYHEEVQNLPTALQYYKRGAKILIFPDLYDLQDKAAEVFDGAFHPQEDGTYEHDVHVTGAHGTVFHMRYKGFPHKVNIIHNLESNPNVESVVCPDDNTVAIRYTSPVEAKKALEKSFPLNNERLKGGNMVLTGRQLWGCPTFDPDADPEEPKIPLGIFIVTDAQVSPGDAAKVILRVQVGEFQDVFSDLHLEGGTDMWPQKPFGSNTNSEETPTQDGKETKAEKGDSDTDDVDDDDEDDDDDEEENDDQNDDKDDIEGDDNSPSTVEDDLDNAPDGTDVVDQIAAEPRRDFGKKWRKKFRKKIRRRARRSVRPQRSRSPSFGNISEAT